VWILRAVSKGGDRGGRANPKAAKNFWRSGKTSYAQNNLWSVN